MSFDKSSFTGNGSNARIQSHGLVAKPVRVKSSGTGPGVVAEVIEFDGKDDHINLEGAQNALRSGADALCVALWLKTTSRKLQFLFDVGFYADSSVTLTFRDSVASFHVTPRAGGVGLQFPLQATNWVHVVVVWDGTRQRAYVNGELTSETQTSRKGRIDSKSVDNLSFLVASQSKSASRGGRYFVGQLDEFALWSRALEATEVKSVFEFGKQGRSLFK